MLISPLPRVGRRISSSASLSRRPSGYYLPITSYGTILAKRPSRFSIISPHVHFTPYHFTPHSFHPTFISPHIHFTPPLSNQIRLRLITIATQFQSFNYQLPIR